jgi:hypothetical protein
MAFHGLQTTDCGQDKKNVSSLYILEFLTAVEYNEKNEYNLILMLSYAITTTTVFNCALLSSIVFLSF